MINRLRFLQYFIVILISISQCSYKIPQKIPLGEWKYKLLVNGVKAGNAKLSSKIIDDKYVSYSELRMGLGDVINISKHTIVETLDFIPIRLESHNSIISNNETQKIDTTASFNGQTVELTTDGHRTKLTIDKEFRLEGNYILFKLIEGGFKKGLEIEINIYEPSIEQEFPIPIKIRVIGIESVDLGKDSRRLMHITESIADVKSIDSYIDENGVMIKTVIQMLNTTIVLIKE